MRSNVLMTKKLSCPLIFSAETNLYMLYCYIHKLIATYSGAQAKFPICQEWKGEKKNSFFDIAQKKRVAILGFSFWLKCENEGIMKVFWCMPSTVMSSSILLQAFTKRCANSKWVTFSLKLKSFKSILSPQILLTWPWNWTWHVL